MSQLREVIYNFAEKYKNVFLDPESTYESVEETGFPEECFRMNFGNDNGGKFIVSTPNYDAFNSVVDLEKVIDYVDNFAIIGSACSGKWNTLDKKLTQEDKLWFVLMLNRIMELTDEPEPMSIEELSALLKEHREEILENTEVNAWDLDIWIHEPATIMNMDSGIAYDVCAVLDISVYDIIDAVEREQMLMAMF